jgi:hypothetical protein
VILNSSDVTSALFTTQNPTLHLDTNQSKEKKNTFTAVLHFTVTAGFSIMCKQAFGFCLCLETHYNVTIIYIFSKHYFVSEEVSMCLLSWLNYFV